MDIFSHTLWANIIWQGNAGVIGLASVLPDLPSGLNWFYHFVAKRGNFWKIRKGFIILILGHEELAYKCKEVNHGPLYKIILFSHSGLAVAIIWIIAVITKLPVILNFFAPAYTLHILIDIFTHKNAELWQPFYPLSGKKIDWNFCRWRLDLSWYVILNFVLLGLLYFLLLAK